jgi:hypothetical protein
MVYICFDYLYPSLSYLQAVSVQKGLKLPATPSKNAQEEPFSRYMQVSRDPPFAFVGTFRYFEL